MHLYFDFTSISPCAEFKLIHWYFDVSACRANGREYKVGESFRQDCNGCTCRSDGQIVCTLIACETHCYHNGKKYSKGESFPSTDGCNTCTCGSNGSVGCTEKACPKFCYYRGRKYTARESFPAIDGCNTCTCEVTGGVSCTEIGCNPGVLLMSS